MGKVELRHGKDVWVLGFTYFPADAITGSFLEISFGYWYVCFTLGPPHGSRI
jgi:hypothetical protein